MKAVPYFPDLRHPTLVFQKTDQRILEVLYAALELEGFQVYALRDGDPDFLKVIGKARPHVVMLDYRFRGEECIEVCQEIKKPYPHCPYWLQAVTAILMSYTASLVFDGYIEKHFELDLLYGILREFIPAEGIKLPASN